MQNEFTNYCQKINKYKWIRLGGKQLFQYFYLRKCFKDFANKFAKAEMK